MKIDKIKEISIMSKYIDLNQIGNIHVHELIRISKGWISFTKTDASNNKELNKWSFKTDDPDYIYCWERLKRDLESELNLDNNNNKNNFTSKFNIRITFDNNDTVDYPFLEDLLSCNLFKTHENILRMIPSGDCELPYITAPFNSLELDKEIFSQLDINDINAIMYAEGGAMGSPGVIQLIDSKYNIYRAETLFNGPDELTQFEVLSKFQFGENDYYDNMLIYINENLWAYLNLGAGNHLYLSMDFYKKFGNILFDVNMGMRYRKFVKLIKW